jgi:hypothetical protein
MAMPSEDAFEADEMILEADRLRAPLDHAAAAPVVMEIARLAAALRAN